MNFIPYDQVKPLAEGYSRNLIPTFPLYVNGRQTALLVLGEAPGKQEDKTGEPFVGWSGQLLRTAYIDYWELQDHADVFLSNAVRCRPPGNRTPKPKEIKAHADMLAHDIAELQSVYSEVFVLCAGAVACQALGMAKTLTAAFKNQGVVLPFAVGKVRAFCTFHPASLADRGKKRRHGPTRARTDKGPALEAHLSLLKRALSGEDPSPEPVQSNTCSWLIAPELPND